MIEHVLILFDLSLMAAVLGTMLAPSDPSHALKFRERYHAPIGRSVTDFSDGEKASVFTQCDVTRLALNVVCCETAIRLEIGRKAEVAGARSKRR